MLEGQNLPFVGATTNYLEQDGRRSGWQSFYVHSSDEHLSLGLNPHFYPTSLIVIVNVYEGLTDGTRTITIAGVDIEIEIVWRGSGASADAVVRAPSHAPAELSTTSKIRVYAVGVDQAELSPELTFYRPYFVEVEFSSPRAQASVEVALDFGTGTRKALARVVPDSGRRLFRTVPFLLYPQGGAPPPEVIAPLGAPR